MKTLIMNFNGSPALAVSLPGHFVIILAQWYLLVNYRQCDARRSNDGRTISSIRFETFTEFNLEEATTQA